MLSGAKNTKNIFSCFTIILECVTNIQGHILHFEGNGRRYLSENPYYQQLSREKKDRNAPESGVKISKFVLHVLQSHLRA